MITVGITGNVAGGKTTVAERWRQRGVRVVDADRLGHEVLREDAAVREALVEAFGAEIIGADGGIDRAALGARAFASPEATRRLNAIVHPPLLARLDRELERARRDGREIVAVDAALIFEFGLDDDLDTLVLVMAPLDVRAERLRRERGLDEARIERVMASQQPDAVKTAKSDFVIVNEGTLEDLRAQADRVLDAIQARTPKARTRKGGGRDG